MKEKLRIQIVKDFTIGLMCLLGGAALEKAGDETDVPYISPLAAFAGVWLKMFGVVSALWVQSDLRKYFEHKDLVDA